VTAADAASGHVDGTKLREVAAELPTGVTVVTTMVDGRPHGCAANAVTSVSLDPPLMLVCLAYTASTHPMISTAGRFAINILPDTEVAREICAVFAGRREEKFAGVDYRTGLTGVPVLADTVGWFECIVEVAYDLGDHTAFVGRVIAAERQEGKPLIFHRGRLHGLTAAS
jgi:flavin reductase (DIM6/NTAB) family NADH-FMN oxidoreductase RutF